MSFRDNHITSAFRALADSLALTPAERRVLQFLIAGCVLGIGVKAAKDLFASPTKFDYSASDSTFAALSSAVLTGTETETGSHDEEDSAVKPVPSGPVRVNSASKAELMSLPGVGDVMAERIILERQDNGPFISVEDLTRVRGIGPRRIEHLRPLVIID